MSHFQNERLPPVHFEEDCGANADGELEWIYHYAPIGLCQLSLDLRFVRINARLAEINGVEASAHIGRNVHEIVPMLAPAAERIAARILATGKPVLDREFAGETKANPGVTRYWRESWYPVLDSGGRISGFGVVAEEITGRKKAEKALRDALDKYKLVVAGAGDAIWVWDIINRRVEYSSRWKHLHGYGEADIGDSESVWLDGIHPDDLARVRKAVNAHLEGETDFFLQEYRVFGKDGGLIWIEDRGVALRDEDGRAYRMAGSERDITWRKAAEDELKAAVARKDEFIAMLAHELRNPLAPINTGLEILERDKELSPRARQILPMMRRKTKQLIRLIEDLLDVARIARGKIELRKAPCDLVEILRDAVETAEPHIAAARHKLSLELSPTPLLLNGDATRLTQVFANLINNAAKFTDTGGHIWVTALRNEDDAVVTVRDDGRGIQPEAIGRIFGLFAQVEDTARSDGNGLGVGLALAKRLVEMHGGSIAAHSAGPGKGAAFTVRLPLNVETVAPARE